MLLIPRRKPISKVRLRNEASHILHEHLKVGRDISANVRIVVQEKTMLGQDIELQSHK